MKKIDVLLFLICCFLTFQSCSDDVSIEDKEFLIEYRISCDTPDAQMHIDANGLDALGIYAKGYYEKKLKTKDFFAVVDVRCTDHKALISVDLYVNGKLRASENGNSNVHISERLKGKGPYLY